MPVALLLPVPSCCGHSNREETPLMRAGIATPNGLAIAEVPRPSPGDNDVLVRVAAAGLNRADLNAARGAGIATSAALAKPIGMEWAGEVVAVGVQVRAFKAGDHVMCSGSGGYAEYAVADHGRCFKLPAGFDLTQAAVLPMALLTAHDAIVTNGGLARGESILVQGASSGVGLMALKLARHLDAATIIGTSTDDARRARLHEFGATLALDPRADKWPEQVLGATGGKGVNLCIDMVSGAGVNQLMQAAAVRGRIVNIGRLGGFRAEFDFDLHALKRLNYIGVTFRTRSIDEIREINRKVAADLWPAIVDGELSLPVDRVFALAEAVAAHDRMRANAHFGKIALRL